MDIRKYKIYNLTGPGSGLADMAVTIQIIINALPKFDTNILGNTDKNHSTVYYTKLRNMLCIPSELLQIYVVAFTKSVVERWSSQF